MIEELLLSHITVGHDANKSHALLGILGSQGRECRQVTIGHGAFRRQECNDDHLGLLLVKRPGFTRSIHQTEIVYWLRISLG
jgi:hypothetical protein